ncbi:MAG: hypothetical protein WEB09_10425 [Nitriliruptor sp.]
MSAGPPPDPADPEPPFVLDHEPFAGFEVAVLVDRHVYAATEPVRITVTAANRSDRFVEHRYPGWQRCVLSVRDELHRVVADDRIDRPAEGDALDRFAPGQLLIQPTYWAQGSGPIVAGWAREPTGPRVPTGRYRVRATWLGREAGHRSELPDAWSPWFELV